MVKSLIPHTKRSWFIIAGAIVGWLLLSFSFYSFLYCIREMFRVMVVSMRGEFIALSDQEHYFYNLFFASTACVTSSGFIVGLLLRNPLLRFGRLKYRKAWLINEQTSLNSYFLYWFAKLGSMFGFWSVMIPLFSYLDFYRDFKFIFIAVPIVLFIYQWSGLRVVLSKSGLKWMVISCFIVFGISFIFSRIDVVDFRALDESRKKLIVEYNYKIELPVASEAIDLPHKEIEHFLYYGFKKDSLKSEIPKIVFRDGQLIEFSLSDLRAYITSFNNDSYNPFFISLSIDQYVKMKYFKALINEISLSGLQRIYFTVASDKYGVSRGLREVLPSHCSEFIGADIEYIKANARLPEELRCARLQYFFKLAPHIISISLKDNQLHVDGMVTTPANAYKTVLAFIEKYGKAGLVQIETDNNSDYGHYTELKNVLWKAYNYRRDQLAYARYNKPCPRDFYTYEREAEKEIFEYIREICPVQYVEWTREEKFIIDFNDHQPKSK